GWGGMAVLDRSWYGRVLVERVEQLTPEKHWRRAYEEINSFERSLWEEGMVLVKCWLHISEREQLERFEKRQSDPLKAWKLTPDAWRTRAFGPLSERAVGEMLARCHAECAPWHVIPGESKRWARVAALETTIAAGGEGLRRHGVEPPPPLR